MLQTCGGSDLGEKPFAAERRTKLRMQHLDRDITIVLEIAREVYRGHAALAEFTLDAVAASESSGEAIGDGAHFPALAVIAFSSLNQF